MTNTLLAVLCVKKNKTHSVLFVLLLSYF